MNVVSNILTAVRPVSLFHQALSYEASVKAQGRHVLVVVSQVFQALSFIDFFKLHTPVPFKAQILAPYILIPAIGTLDYILDDDSPYKKPIHWLSNHFGQLMQVAVGIHALALCCLGFYTYGAVSLTFLTWGLLEKRLYLPLKVRHVYEATGPYIRAAVLLINPNPLIKLISVIVLGSFVYPKVSALWARHFPKPKEALAPLTYEQFQQMEQKRNHLKVSGRHIAIDPYPQTAERDLNNILQAWDTIDWSTHAFYLELSVATNSRWQQSEDKAIYDRAAAQDKPGILIAYAKKQLNALVNNLQTRRPPNYAPLKNYLDVIAKRLPYLDPDTRRTLLVKLALDEQLDGKFDFFTQLLDIATPSLREIKSLPFEGRVRLLLQLERLNIVQAYHFFLEELNPLSSFNANLEGVHPMNRTIRLLAEGFHLPNTGVSTDGIRPILMFERWFYRKFAYISSENLWIPTALETPSGKIEIIEGYTSQKILEVVYGSKRANLLSNDDFVTWARAWIQKPETGATADQKQAFLEKFRNASDPKNDALIPAALVDMGILEG